MDSFSRRLIQRSVIASSFILMFSNSPALIAGEVTIVNATASQTGSGEYRFDVTLKHEDTGWDHYADRWEVLAPNGNILATRMLYHPHVNEQPFSRSLSGVTIPATMSEVEIRAHDSVHGYNPKLLSVSLPYEMGSH